MNLRTSQLYLSFFFLLTLISCEKPSDIGLNLPGQNQLGTHFEKQAALAATVIHPDSILAFKNDPIAVGKVTDGLLGTISATHYTEIGLNGTNITFEPGPNPNASLELVLAYNGFYYGDTTTAIKLNVYKLAKNFVNNQVYFTNTKILTDNQLLGSITFKPKPNRETRDGKDFSRLLRIPLDNAFANEFMGKTFTTQDNFRDFWEGIAIGPDPSSASGSIVGFTPIPDSAKTPLAKVGGINLRFTNKDNKVQTHNFSFSGTYYYNGTEITRQGPLATLDKPNKELPSQQTNNVTYVQANSGVKTHITFPNITDFKENKGNVFINHAELIIPVMPGSINTGNFISPAPPRLFAYEATLGNRIPKTAGGTAIAVQNGNSPAFNLLSPATATFVADSLHYKFNITSYVQALIDKRKANNGVIITPTPEDNASASAAGLAWPGTLNLNRALIDATGKKMVLRIYYSELK